MVNNKISEQIIQQINKWEWILPCLFLGNNSEILYSEVMQIAQSIVNQKNIPSSYIYSLKDNREKIKIWEVKWFLEKIYSKPWYEFQIFIFENISRLTIQSANSCLKFFEEPGKHNIIFLTNESESWLLDTILSRVQTIQMWWIKHEKENIFFQSLIKEIHEKNPEQSLNYFFNLKWEKEEYINFLENIIIYAKNNYVFIDTLSEIESDIQWIKQNNVNAKYIIDKYLLTLW